ncbi:DUF664 domain-containing protein [Kribbella sandramycini]|uniref:DUF664 domain-containing protein n=1 Tax=Kribbella sandramycini TaxID=60450 RepID=A0A7Y4KZP3_9ACTN|nr:DinB family protein [Kribbella sandramycini]MBB6565350.1 putative damage-inducible protein DinB [Kribbella sandramycini]NOL41619.1 DUF664 domain-containing protein [Kribbella sandramycini]
MDFYAERPPHAADERTQLVGWLDLQRKLVRHKLDGLKPDDEHRGVFPDSPLMTPAGLVAHLKWTEHCWFNVIFSGEPKDSNPQFRQDLPDDAEWMVEGVPLAQLLAEYDAQWARSNEITAAHGLDELGQQEDFKPSLRWVLIHMVEETARHVGQLDTMRELLDGQRGYY